MNKIDNQNKPFIIVSCISHLQKPGYPNNTIVGYKKAIEHYTKWLNEQDVEYSTISV